VIELELEPGETVVVHARVPEHLRRDRALRVVPPLLGVEAEAADLALRERGRPRRIGLSREVDEAVRAVAELLEHVRGPQAQDPCDDRRDGLWLLDLERVGVDRRRLLTDRELHAGAVVDRPAGGGHGDDLAVLLGRQLPERRRADALEPERTAERGSEEEREEREEKADPAVRQPPAHRVRRVRRVGVRST
jgi:hypothetical protein